MMKRVVEIFFLQSLVWQRTAAEPSSSIQDDYVCQFQSRFPFPVKTSCVLFHGDTIEEDNHVVRIHTRSLDPVSLELTYNSTEDSLFVDIQSEPPPIPNYISMQNPLDASNVDKLIGVALDGIPMYSALSSTGSDLLADLFEYDKLDGFKIDYCGGIFGMTPDGPRYHYRVMPTCILNSENTQAKRSIFISAVHELLESFLSFRGSYILGYSLLGHPIYSPYTSRGLLQDKLDNCNGKFDVNGTSYGYFVTPVFPYILACEGPGVYNTKESGTSDNVGLAAVANVQYTTCPGGYYPATFDGKIETNGCLPCPAGKYSGTSYSSRSGSRTGSGDRPPCHMIAPQGYFSPPGSSKPIKCPAGRYGAVTGLGDVNCSGPCRAGHFCPTGSSIDTAYACAGPAFFCPVGTSVRYGVDVGFYSGPESSDSMHREYQLPCGPGTFCEQGIRRPCPAGRFGSSLHLFDANCTASCPMGSYCPTGSVQPVLCPAGRYGETEGLRSSECSDSCGLGHWCPAGSTSIHQVICAAGRYGAERGLTTAACSPLCEPAGGPNTTSSEGNKYCTVRSCAAGYHCPPGSIRATEAACGGSQVYCPPHSVVPTPVDRGWYSIGPLSVKYAMQVSADVNIRNAQVICEPGFFCIDGVRRRCPRGYFGSDFGLNSTTCNGQCLPGYRCDEASPSPSQHDCWRDSSHYCPLGSFEPIEVPSGYYSIGRSETTRYSIEHCPPGTYCDNGRKLSCPRGTYSSIGSTSVDCDGLCDAGYYCPMGSTSPKQFPCPAGRFGTVGMESEDCAGSCLEGYYCPAASTKPFEKECGNEYFYCPHGAAAPVPVSKGFFSTGGNSTTRFGQSKCSVSEYLGTPPAGEVRHNVCPSTTVS